MIFGFELTSLLLRPGNKILKIIKRLEHLIYIHCKEQILAGADIIQLFDSWAGLIEKKNLKEFCINPNKNIVNKIRKNFPNNPVICFPKGINQNINNFSKIIKLFSFITSSWYM